MSSYLLDKELLSALNSARATTTTTTTSHNWIDVNSNAALLGSNVYQRTCENDMRKTMADLQDQIKMLRTDVEKKDKLITDLSSVRGEHKVKFTEQCKHEVHTCMEKTLVDQCKKDLNTMSQKYEHVVNELSEFKGKVQARDERIAELKREIDALKSENGTLNAMIVAQRTKIKELECDLGGVESSNCKADITIATYQKDIKELQKTVLELESRIRTHMMEREEAERKTDVMNGKLTELASKISTVTCTTITGNTAGLDVIITKIGEIVNENNLLKGKLVTTVESLTHQESENKANRETIQRLVNELNKIEKDSNNNRLTLDNMKVERDTAKATSVALEKEIATLKDRLATVQTAWQATKKELDTREHSYSSQSHTLKQLDNEILYHKNCLSSFKEQVAALLSDGYVKVEANEDHIKDKIKMLMTSSKDRGLIISTMENKTQQMANQLTEQINIYKEMESKYHHAECQIVELENRLKKLDGDYCATEVLRDNLKSDRVKYLSFLERIGSILKISQISADVGLDMNIDLILARAEQLVKSETDSLQDKQTSIYNLQRKVKSMKEQLDNKELHLDLLRKKVSALEEERSSKCALEREVDDHVAMSKKFKSKVEKLTEQLNNLKSENSELKAKLLEVTSFKSRSCDQDKEICRLLERIKELETIKEKQSIKLAKYREEIDNVSVEVSKSRSTSDSTVQCLSQELRHLKIDLEKSQSREKQLIDFRSVIARMLGLDASSLAVADYEIIARIERLIASFNGVVLPVQVQSVVRIPTPTASINQQSTYTKEECYSSTSSSASPTRHHHHRQRSPSPHRHHHHHHHDSTSSSSVTRTRSKSPRKVTIDPNSY